MTLPSHVVELLEHAARHPDGGLPLLDAQLECCASLYQVHPTLVESARRACESREARAEAEAILSRHLTPVEIPPAPAPTPRDVEAVIAAAAALPHGLDLLAHGPVETAAVLLGAHPFVIEEARRTLTLSTSRSDA